MLPSPASLAQALNSESHDSSAVDRPVGVCSTAWAATVGFCGDRRRWPMVVVGGEDFFFLGAQLSLLLGLRFWMGAVTVAGLLLFFGGGCCFSGCDDFGGTNDLLAFLCVLGLDWPAAGGKAVGLLVTRLFDCGDVSGFFISERCFFVFFFLGAASAFAMADDDGLEGLERDALEGFFFFLFFFRAVEEGPLGVCFFC